MVGCFEFFLVVVVVVVLSQHHKAIHWENDYSGSSTYLPTTASPLGLEAGK